MTRSSLVLVRRLGVARLISVMGGEAAYIGLMILVLQQTNSPAWVAGVLIAWIAMGGVAAPFAGSLGDRYDRKVVMILSDLGGAIAFVGIALAGSPLLVVVLAGVASCVEAPFVPASTAAMPNLVSEEELPGANAYLASWRTVGYLLGPILGGLGVAAVGPRWMFALDAASFLVSAYLVSTLPGRFAAAGAATMRLRGSMGEGFRFLRHHTILRRMVLAWAVALLTTGVVLVAEPGLARSFGVGSVGYGALIAAWGGGVFVGTRLVTRLARRWATLRVIVVGAAMMGGGILVGSVTPWFAALVVGMVIGGIGNGINDVAEETVIQMETPDAVRSRVVAAMDTVALGSFGLSFASGAFLVEAFGPRPAYLLSGLGLFGCSAIMATLRRERSLQARGLGALPVTPHLTPDVIG